MAAAEVVAEDAVLRTLGLEGFDEAVPHVEGCEEGVAERDGGRCGVWIAF